MFGHCHTMTPPRPARISSVSAIRTTSPNDRREARSIAGPPCRALAGSGRALVVVGALLQHRLRRIVRQRRAVRIVGAGIDAIEVVRRRRRGAVVARGPFLHDARQRIVVFAVLGNDLAEILEPGVLKRAAVRCSERARRRPRRHVGRLLRRQSAGRTPDRRSARRPACRSLPAPRRAGPADRNGRAGGCRPLTARTRLCRMTRLRLRRVTRLRLARGALRAPLRDAAAARRRSSRWSAADPSAGIRARGRASGAAPLAGSTQVLRAASASTLRIDSSSARRSRVTSFSLSGGLTLRNCATNAVRARSYRARRASPVFFSSPATARAISG